MESDRTPGNSSTVLSGGCVDGSGEVSAYRLVRHEPSPIPILIAVPHAGRIYTDDLRRTMRTPDETALRLEDRLVDEIGDRLAQATKASLLIADAPRAMVDLNRASDEVDWSMVKGGAQDRTIRQPVGRRVRSGLGLVPRRLPSSGEIWRGPIDSDELDRRIEAVHKPYHEALGAELRRLRERWGAALLIDLHSMPPLSQSGEPQIVLGDRFGASCSAALSASVVQHLQSAGLIVAQNRPYAGGYVLDRHAAPRRSIHAMQIEVCRSTYLDKGHTKIGGQADEMVEVLAGLIQFLAGEIAALGSATAGKLAAE